MASTKKHKLAYFYEFTDGTCDFLSEDEAKASDRSVLIGGPRRFKNKGSFFYTFSNGEKLQMYAYDAMAYCKLNNVTIIKDSHCMVAIQGGAFDSKMGYNPGLGEFIKSPAHYKQVLKEKGLIEVGSETNSTQSAEKKSLMDDSDIKEMVDAGADISGNEAKMLKSIKN